MGKENHAMLSEGDAAWPACDAQGCIAVFTTAGEGPMPDWISKSDREIAGAITGLPIVGKATLLVQLPDATWFETVACCGVYAYDWCVDEYRLLATPTTPVKLGDLPAAIACAARRTTLPTVEFGLATAFNPVRLLSSTLNAS